MPGTKRAAPDSPVGAGPPVKKSMHDTLADPLKAMGVGGDLADPIGGRPVGPKGPALKAAAASRPEASPVSVLAAVPTRGTIGKVDAPNAGDHSPSISALNGTRDQAVGVTGRGAPAEPGAPARDEHHGPPVQLQGAHIAESAGARDKIKGSATHTALTTLREAHGVGERDANPTLDDTLDGTLRAYSPYDATGERDDGGVKLPKMPVYSERGGSAQPLVKGAVDPTIGQAAMNLWYRDPGFATDLPARAAAKRPPED